MLTKNSAALAAVGSCLSLLLFAPASEASTWANMPGAACAWDSVTSSGYSSPNGLALGVKNAQFWTSGSVPANGSTEYVAVDCPVGNSSVLPDSSINTATIDLDVSLCTDGSGCNSNDLAWSISACVVSGTGLTVTCGTATNGSYAGTGHYNYSVNVSAFQGDTSNTSHPFLWTRFDANSYSNALDWAVYILGYYVST